MPDFTDEIASIIDSVPNTEMYPCVFFDLTLSFSNKVYEEYGTEYERNRPISSLTRSELLQIGRSCNPRVLRRFGAILTRLTVVASAREIPDHISSTSADQVAKIPLVLATEKYNKQFWKVLLHTIEPGTKLSARSTALLAALSLRMGIVPLMKVAQGMLAFKDNWNDPATPQTWNKECLTLLLHADEAHQKQQDMGLTKNQSRILNPTDRTLFERLVTCKHLEHQIDNRLPARVPRIAEKAIASVGPLVTCRDCQYPRSVTIMGADGKCGPCLSEYVDEKTKEICINRGVSKDVTTSSKVTWVECISKCCRAQYVIYRPDVLVHPAECHYCRSQRSPAPTVQCDKCSNRMIWPGEYRTSAFKESDFICPLCTSGCDPTTKLEVTLSEISTENTFPWLVQDTNDPKLCLRNGSILHIRSESIFQIITRMGSEGFLSRISIFPSSEPQLRYDGKPIHNSKELISTLQKLVKDRKTSDKECSLCFSRYMDGLHPACGRDGCLQKMCTTCLVEWYRHNSPGCVINTAVLGCPFCRRYPTLRLVVKYGLGIHGVKDLAKAVRDNGKFIYAWCWECDTAKVAMKRSCMLGEPLELKDWACRQCHKEIWSGKRGCRRRQRRNGRYI
ncbi:hypothetical protein N7471_008469 [Penicillium samsonianum]|uniref:uncharacterized protein n=1 Tax=Penicillium samsonianum TaxID=1882272 RepID=UPI0025491E16|nr:uncharacterized protein N7471_008469 [Penicillium samsonianum]KAJ6133254.1 hypothetical protein N7471_008469 [Penicillium samsonianum]